MYIKLTQYHTNLPLYINTNHIQYVGQFKKRTQLRNPDGTLTYEEGTRIPKYSEQIVTYISLGVGNAEEDGTIGVCESLSIVLQLIGVSE